MDIKKSSKIIKAKVNDWGKVLYILQTCGEWLRANNLYNWFDPKNWKESVWTKERVIRRIKKKEVYLIYVNQKPVGTITLSTEPAFYYEESDKKFWQDKEATAIYLSGLAVLPDYKKRGLAILLIDFAESKVEEKGIKYIRFDTPVLYSKYIGWLIDFYVNNGYKIKGTRKTPGGHDSYFFEKSFG